MAESRVTRESVVVITKGGHVDIDRVVGDDDLPDYEGVTCYQHRGWRSVRRFCFATDGCFSPCFLRYHLSPPSGPTETVEVASDHVHCMSPGFLEDQLRRSLERLCLATGPPYVSLD